jgi:predicted nucleic acid-binding protein
MRYFLDSSVIISILRRNRVVVNYLNDLDVGFDSSYVCLAEIYEGVINSNSPKSNLEAVNKIFKSFGKVYGLDQKIAWSFGELRAKLRNEGNLIEDIDLLIAATCFAYNLTLFTQNPKHFTRIRDLEIITV